MEIDMVLIEMDAGWRLYEIPEESKPGCVRVAVADMATKRLWSFWYIPWSMGLSCAGDVLHPFRGRHEWVTAVMRRRYR
jgi:hypothetical protein